ncbi:MAG TPA: glycosyltransferase [candidate division Zixibacteria bacterium]|nr:glycosyltransferase [candidate division Zixibacteria bacterium]
MLAIYTLIWVLIILIFGVPLIIIGILRGEKISQRLGIWQNAPANAVWIHASSVGETSHALTLARSIRNISDMPVIISSTTITGYKQLLKNASEGIYIYQQPIDFPPILSFLCGKIRPQKLIIIESDMWLGMIWAVKRVGAPIIIVSGRLSGRTVRFARIFRPYFSFMFSQIDKIYARSEEDRKNFIAAGAPPEKVSVAGDLKTAPAKQDFALERPHRFPVVVFGSVREREEDLFIRAAAEIVREYPKVLVIFAPRHPERFDPVARKLAQSGIRFARRSESERFPENCPVYLLDTIGELRKFYSVADIAVIGGTFEDYGGHNPFEATVCGVPVVHGRYTSNNRHLFETLDSAGAAFEVSPEQLVPKVLEMASDADYLNRLKQRAKQTAEKIAASPEKYARMILADETK